MTPFSAPSAPSALSALSPLPVHHAGMIDDPAQLIEILRPELNLVVWRCHKPAWWESTMQTLVQSSFEECQWVVPRGIDAHLLAEVWATELSPTLETTPELGQWLSEVTLRFLEVSSLPFAGVRMERVRNNQCSAFHVDRLHLRLITTLIGPGTLWLQNSDVRRDHLGHGQDGCVMAPDSQVQEIQSPWVGILKGESFPGNVGNGIVHKSPPIEGTGLERIVLRIDGIKEV